jgi:hypothetical protein
LRSCEILFGATAHFICEMNTKRLAIFPLTGAQPCRADRHGHSGTINGHIARSQRLDRILTRNVFMNGRGLVPDPRCRVRPDGHIKIGST